MSYPLPDSVRALQAKVRKFVDEVAIPRELEAEANPEAGREFRAEAKEFATANGLMAMTLPKELGGGGLSFLEQAVVNEQGGRATDGQGWCYT